MNAPAHRMKGRSKLILMGAGNNLVGIVLVISSHGIDRPLCIGLALLVVGAIYNAAAWAME
jgi:hypothetical protein